MSEIRKMDPNSDDAGLTMDTYEEVKGHLLPGLFFTVVVLGMLSFAVIKITDPATLPIRHVSVTGDFVHLSPSSLEQRVGDVVRGGFFNVNVDAIQTVLLQEPWVREVAVKRIWPDRITVNIREQVAIARWGDQALLNPEAEIFSPDHSTFPADLPVLNGPENTNNLVVENFELIRKILPDGLYLDELSLSERRSWEFKLNTGPVFRLGKTEVIDRIRTFLEFFPIDDLNAPGKIEYIDMRYTNGFAIRWKNEDNAELQNIREIYGKKI